MLIKKREGSARLMHSAGGHLRDAVVSGEVYWPDELPRVLLWFRQIHALLSDYAG